MNNIEEMIEKNLKYKFTKIKCENTIDFVSEFSGDSDNFNSLHVYDSSLDLKDLKVFRKLTSLVLSKVKITNRSELDVSYFDNITYLELEGEDALSLLDIYSFNKVSRLFLSNSSYFKCDLKHLVFIEELVVKSIEKIAFISFPINYLYALKISDCDVINFDDKIFDNLLSLQHIELNFLKLKEVPKSIFNLKQLMTLSLSGNIIKQIPKQLIKLKLLRELSLTNMEIDIFDYEFYRASDLSLLNLDNTSIRVFPKNFKMEQMYLFISLQETQLRNYNKGEFTVLVNEYMHDCD